MAQAKQEREGPSPGPMAEETRQHLRAAREEFRRGFEGLLPPEAMRHGRRARKEMLLAARSLIDHALKRIEDAGEA